MSPLPFPLLSTKHYTDTHVPTQAHIHLFTHPESFTQLFWCFNLSQLIKVQCLCIILPSYCIIFKYHLSFLFAYLVILEEITLISFYLQKYLTKPYSTCSLYILVILWIVELNSATATSRTNLQTIIAQHLWGLGSEHLSGLRREGTAEGAPAWLTKPEARTTKRLDGLEFTPGALCWTPR